MKKLHNKNFRLFINNYSSHFEILGTYLHHHRETERERERETLQETWQDIWQSGGGGRDSHT